MLNKLGEPEYLLIVILVLLVALLVVGAGKGGGKLLLQLLKRALGHEEVNINLGGGDMSGKPKPTPCAGCTIVDPKLCPLHEAEHERSIRNEKGIAELTNNFRNTTEKLWGKLDGMDGTLTEIKVAVAKLVVETKYQQSGRGGKES